MLRARLLTGWKAKLFNQSFGSHCQEFIAASSAFTPALNLAENRTARYFANHRPQAGM